MRHLVEVLQALQHPWIDPRVFNMEPDELYSGSWCQRLRPLLAVPNQATHEQGGKWRLLSFFLVHPSLVGDIVGWSSWPGLVRGGHRPVGLRLGCRQRGVVQLERTLRRVKPLPLEEPIGCRSDPCEWPLVDVCTHCQQRGGQHLGQTFCKG